MRSILIIVVFSLLGGCGRDDQGSGLLIETDYSTITGVGGDAQFRVKWEHLKAGSQWEPNGQLQFYLSFQACVASGGRTHCQPIDLQQGFEAETDRSKGKVYAIKRYGEAEVSWYLGFSGIDLEVAARKLPAVLYKEEYFLALDLWEKDAVYDDHMARATIGFRELNFDTVVELKDKASDAAVRLRFVDAYTENRDH